MKSGVAALGAGVVGFLLGGPVGAIVAASVTGVVVKKKEDEAAAAEVAAAAAQAQAQAQARGSSFFAPGHQKQWYAEDEEYDPYDPYTW